MSEPSPSTVPQDRSRQIAAVAKELLDAEGPDGLSMRRVAAQVGVTAPALYRYFPDKAQLEDAIISEAHWELGDACAARLVVAREEGRDELLTLVRTYREWAREHPHLYRLVYCSPIGRNRRDPAAESYGADQLRGQVGHDPAAAGAIWALCHGIVMLELDGRMTEAMSSVAILERGVAALRPD